MAIGIGSNIASLKAIRQISAATDTLASTYERLSSGLRINNAGDDAASLAISENLNAKGKIYSQAIRNINDGVSLTNIAQGAIESLSGVITRQKELAEQAANGTYSAQQRVALTSEYNRIIKSTSFNGVNILNGSNNYVRIQQGEGEIESTLFGLGINIGVQAGDGTF